MRKNDAFDAKIVNMRLTKIFIAIFAPEKRLPSSATLHCILSLVTLVIMYTYIYDLDYLGLFRTLYQILSRTGWDYKGLYVIIWDCM